MDVQSGRATTAPDGEEDVCWVRYRVRHHTRSLLGGSQGSGQGSSEDQTLRIQLQCVQQLMQVPRLNSTRHYYFNRVIRIWITLPPLDLELSLTTLKKQIHSTFWDYFTTNNYYCIHLPCTWYICCPCTTCITSQAHVSFRPNR